MDLSMAIKVDPSCIQNRERLKAILRDMFPMESLSVNLALVAYDAGIVERLYNTTDVDDMLMAAFVRKLTDECGLQEKNAISAICMWAAAIGVNFDKAILRLNSTVKIESGKTSVPEVKRLSIDESNFLEIYADDFRETQCLKSCCRIIDILYKYAANLENKYSAKIQQDCYKLCLHYLDELKRKPKDGKSEKPYDYLALYIEGALRFINADFMGAVKAWNAFSDFSEFNNLEKKVSWTDDRIDLKIAIYSNLYFIYDLFQLDFGKSVAKTIVEKAMRPKTSHYEELVYEIKERIRRNPECANEPYDPNFQSASKSNYKPTNEGMLNHYMQEIRKRENWYNDPKIMHYDLEFKDYGDMVSSDLAGAVHDETSIFVHTTEIRIVQQNDSILLDGWWGSKTILEHFSSNKNELATKIRLLYM